MSFTHVSCDKKAMTLSQLKRMFDAGDFTDPSHYFFTPDDMKQMLALMVAGMPIPQFGAVQLESGQVVFRTGKLQQFITAALEFADDTNPDSQMSGLQRRRIHTATYVEFIVIPQAYNKDMSIDEMNAHLAFYL